MAKGNMLLGYARGKVGSLVYARMGGDQITKAYNGSPNNPKTPPQILQRCHFLAANKFYQRGVQNLFRFAFEDKKRNESDFNAFMRNNIGRGVPLSMFNGWNPRYPAIGKWIMTKGSLGAVNLSNLNTARHIINIDLERADDMSWGAFCRKLAERYNVENGDLFTLVVIKQSIGNIFNYPSLTWHYSSEPEWIILQKRIDTSSMDDAESFFQGYLLNLSNSYFIDAQGDANTLSGATFILSKNTRRGLKVTTSELCLSLETEGRWSYGMGWYYTDSVIKYYAGSSDALLKPLQIIPFSISSSSGIGATVAEAKSQEPRLMGTYCSAPFPENAQCYVYLQNNCPYEFDPEKFSIESNGTVTSFSYLPNIGCLSLSIIAQNPPSLVKVYYENLLVCYLLKTIPT